MTTTDDTDAVLDILMHAGVWRLPERDARIEALAADLTAHVRERMADAWDEGMAEGLRTTVAPSRRAPNPYRAAMEAKGSHYEGVSR